MLAHFKCPLNTYNFLSSSYNVCKEIRERLVSATLSTDANIRSGPSLRQKFSTFFFVFYFRLKLVINHMCKCRTWAFYQPADDLLRNWRRLHRVPLYWSSKYQFPFAVSSKSFSSFLFSFFFFFFSLLHSPRDFFLIVETWLGPQHRWG